MANKKIDGLTLLILAMLAIDIALLIVHQANLKRGGEPGGDQSA